jgi:hypothetical protein
LPAFLSNRLRQPSISSAILWLSSWRVHIVLIKHISLQARFCETVIKLLNFCRLNCRFHYMQPPLKRDMIPRCTHAYVFWSFFLVIPFRHTKLLNLSVVTGKCKICILLTVCQ